MEICFQKNKLGIYSEACPEVKLRALAASQETKLLTASCRQAIKYAKEGLPAEVPQWFEKRFKDFCKKEIKDKGDTFKNKSDKQKLLLFSEDQKGKHPFINFCARGYDTSEITDKKTKAKKKGPWRKQKYVRLSGLVAIDLDDVDDAMAIYKRWEEKVDFKALMIYLIYLTPRLGLRVVFRCDASRGNLIDNQLWMCQQLCVDGVEVEPDDSCKDASRGYFLTSEENFLYDNLKELYEDEPDKDFIEKYEPDYRAGRSASTKTAAVASKTTKQGAGNVSQVDGESVSLNFKGRPYSEIIEEWWKLNGGVPQEGERNVKLYQLAVNLRAICDNNPQILMKVMPRLGLEEEELRSIVESACKETPKGISKPMREILDGPFDKLRDRSDNGINAQLDQWGAEIESMFDDFPLLRDVCAGLKRSQYPAALFVAGGTMMTLMTRCWYRFYHRPQQERRLNCSLYIIGHPASNKSMADDIYKLLSSPIAAADKAGKAALNRYKQDQKKKAANKEGKDKPQALIRIHPARTSNGQMIQDMLNAKDTVEGKEIQLHMLTFDTELDNSITLQSGGSWINKQSMELKAFHNEEDGQMYQNSDSPVDEFNVTWNFIYTGTPIALKKKVNERNFGSGLSTRLAVIPMPKTNFEMMALEEVRAIDWQRIERMKTWAFKLDTRFGELPFWPLVKRIYEWVKNRMEDCAEDESEANELMLKRVPYHALNYAAPFIDMRHFENLHLEGKYWEGTYEVDDTDWKLCELIARIQYATQQHFFGVMAEKYFDDMNNDVQITGKRHQQKSVDGYNRLPEVFTTEDVMKCFGYSSDSSVNGKIKRLIDANLVVKCESYQENGHVRYKYKKVSAMGI